MQLLQRHIQKIRVNGDFNKTKTNVLKLIDLINKSTFNTKLVVSFVEQNKIYMNQMNLKITGLNRVLKML